jgi:hypothetical protein
MLSCVLTQQRGYFLGIREEYRLLKKALSVSLLLLPVYRDMRATGIPNGWVKEWCSITERDLGNLYTYVQRLDDSF